MPPSVPYTTVYIGVRGDPGPFMPMSTIKPLFLWFSEEKGRLKGGRETVNPRSDLLLLSDRGGKGIR